ncbi:MAG: carbohydrate-binding domain-containing protein [Rothia sp. (in: high G+C Gram-positive bacteria)]|uniref:carbohydrate-binding domain-containing protein n=1 Tax=Rothia sp. (in: high G+C Gram-positive bacteria) TaxID=1885016 RepID=UPI0026DB2432|nr:carbohydrate-binding domain-containing protein [Rothia sp. (in: high G+C Gram-positive bacteria)]MDO4884769.1 carbohydrate-binding domain-containing protein [Rothia sp. (in: high G+C Gram-positive bacteria)]
MKNSMLKTVTSVTLIAALGLTGCSTASGTTLTSGTSTVHSAVSGTTAGTSTSNTAAGQTLDAQTHYTNEDLTWDSSGEKTIDLANPTATDGVSVENGTITITSGGTYRITGEYSGQVKIEAAKTDTVRLVLDNAKITNSTGAAINVVSAAEAIIYTAAGTTNTVADEANYTATGDDDPDAAIYSTANLTLTGEGSLSVKGAYEEGIHTTGGLVIASGTLDVNAANTGIKGKDYVDITGGIVNVTAAQDGIKSTNTDDESLGFTRLSAGSVTISAGDDGLKAPHTLEISGGTLNIEKSNEGIEAQYINILDGDVTVNSSDDGINASLKDSSSDTSSDTTSGTATTGQQTQQNQNGQVQQAPAGGGAAPGGSQGSTGQNQNMPQPPTDGAMPGGGGGTFEVVDAAINISGGTVTVNAEGDGIDSNGTATFSGGTVTVNGPTAGGNNALDSNGDLLLNGGTVTTGSTADMFEAPSSASTSGYLKITDSSALTQGSTVQVTDSSGTVVANYKITTSGVQLVLVSNKNIVKGQSYTVSVTSGSVDAASTTAASGASELGSFTAA